MISSSGLYSQSYYHPPKIQLLPPPEVTRIRCLVNQDRKPRPLQRKTSFLQRITGRAGGKKEEPLRKVHLTIDMMLKHKLQEASFARDFLQQQRVRAY